MAKRKGKKAPRRRRRRVGAIALNAASPTVQIGSAIAGFLFAKPINGMIDKVVPVTTDQKLVAAGQGGIGLAYALMKGRKNLALTVVTCAVAGAGVRRGMTALGIMGRIGGYGNVPALGGYGNVPALGAPRKMGAYGVPGTVNGYAPNSMVGAGNGGYSSKNGSMMMG